jgi:hypothetical protein
MWRLLGQTFTKKRRGCDGKGIMGSKKEATKKATGQRS